MIFKTYTMYSNIYHPIIYYFTYHASVFFHAQGETVQSEKKDTPLSLILLYMDVLPNTNGIT